jgi:hypothetical protein
VSDVDTFDRLARVRLRACQHEKAIDHKAMPSIATGEALGTEPNSPR